MKGKGKRPTAGNDGGPTVEVSAVSEPHHGGQAAHFGGPGGKAKKSSGVAVPVAVPEVAAAGLPGPRPSEPYYGGAHHLQPQVYYSHGPPPGGSGASVATHPPPTVLPKVGTSGAPTPAPAVAPGGDPFPDPGAVPGAVPGESTTTVSTVEHPDGSATVTTVTRTRQPDGTIVEDVVTSTLPPGARGGMPGDGFHQHQHHPPPYGMPSAYEQANQQYGVPPPGQQHYPPPPGSDMSGSYAGGVGGGGSSAVSGVSGGPPPPPGSVDAIYHPGTGASGQQSLQSGQPSSSPPPNAAPAPANAPSPTQGPTGPATGKQGFCADKRNRTVAIVAAVVVVLGGIGAALGLTLGRSGGGGEGGGGGISGTDFAIPDLGGGGDPADPVTDPEKGGPSACALRTDGQQICADVPGFPFALCGDTDDFASQCSFWFVPEDGSEHKCCNSCALCPPGCSTPVKYDCTNVMSTVPKTDCGVCEGGTPPTSPPAAQPAPEADPESEPAEDASVCAQFGGDNQVCQEAAEDLQVCVELSPDQRSCSVWFTNAAGENDICCNECTVCDEGCGFSMDCTNYGEGLSIGCNCENSQSYGNRKRRDLGVTQKRRRQKRKKVGRDLRKFREQLKQWTSKKLKHRR